MAVINVLYSDLQGGSRYVPEILPYKPTYKISPVRYRQPTSNAHASSWLPILLLLGQGQEKKGNVMRSYTWINFN